MKILITGGAGYIGSVLTEKLLNKNYKVTVIDNFMFSQKSLNHLMHNKNLKVENNDIRNTFNFKTLINKNDVIIPLAAYVGAPLCLKDPVNAHQVNFESNKYLLKQISNSQLIIMPTTNSGYGKGDKNGFCDESSKLNPLSKYAKDKVEIEKILMERENSVSFRLATVFGSSPRMRFDLLVNDFVYKAYFDKYIVLFESNFRRNYIHVKDVCNAIEMCLEKTNKFKGEIFNVGLSSANLTKLELANKIKEYIKDFVIIQENFTKDTDQRDYLVSNKKIEKLGFKPMFSLDDGIKEISKLLITFRRFTDGNV